jgi:hypothetical protein
MKQNVHFSFESHSTLLFLVFRKNSLIKILISFGDLSLYKIPRYHVDWHKFCILQSSVNIGMVEDTGLKSMASRSTSTA